MDDNYNTKVIEHLKDIESTIRKILRSLSESASDGHQVTSVDLELVLALSQLSKALRKQIEARIHKVY
jgi:hypothetical protein